MIYICVQPDISYFHWQIEVMLSSFKEVGLDLKKCYIVLLYNVEKSNWSSDILKKYPDINIFCYRDGREKKHYPPSIKPYGISLFLKENKDFENKSMFYHDSDIIFIEKIDESKIKDKSCWYLSDTVSYIGFDYIKSKGEKQAKSIFDFFGIEQEIVKKNQLNSGGAQYVINNTNHFFWEKVYRDSNDLYDFLCEKEKEFVGEGYPLQKWCAEMWSTLWNAWLCNIETKIIEELDFCFATDRIYELKNKKIIHNAGVVSEDREKMFFKGDYINIFPNQTNIPKNIDQSYCSFLYLKQLKKNI